MLKAIFFDAAQTLIYLPRRAGEHYRDVAAAFGVDLDAGALDQAFRQAWKEAPDRPAGTGPREDDDKGWWRGLVARVLDLTLPETLAGTFPREDYFEKLYAHFTLPGVWKDYPEAREVLDALRNRGIRLGVISNFDRRLYAVLDGLELTGYFQHIIVSSEVGADKPDPAIFRHALDVFGVEPSEALHAGDDPKKDWGAEGVGMEVFRLERPQNSLRDLLPRIEERLQSPSNRDR